MKSRFRHRLLQGLVLLAVLGAGVWGWHRVVRPDPALLIRLAEEKLVSIFGPWVTYGDVRIDLVDGVTIEDLTVCNEECVSPTLEARRVVLRHDLLALASGLYRPEAITIHGARIAARETEDGAAFDFPFTLEATEGDASIPRIEVRDATILFHPMAGSARLREGPPLEVSGLDLDVTPRRGGRLSILGSFATKGLGQDRVRITISGHGDAAADDLLVGAVWDPFVLTPLLIDRLADDLAEKVRSQSGESGHLVVSISRDPNHEQGRIQVAVSWRGRVRLELDELPGGEVIDVQSREQLQALLRGADLAIEVTPEAVSLDALVDALGGGEIEVRGEIRDDGDDIHLSIHLRDLRLDDAGLREALGEQERAIFEQFEPGGWVDADVRITKRPGGDLRWTIDAILEDASFRYVGAPEADGTPGGFPYLVEHTTGQIHVSDGRIWFDDVYGMNGREARIRLRSPWESAWTGGETGRIRFTDEGLDLRLTVEARTVPTDHELDRAIQGSEFSAMMEEFYLDGLLDMIEVDIISVPGRDEKAYAEVRLTVKDETFRYEGFPLLLSDVEGWLTMTRPFLTQTTRGREFKFDVRGKSDNASVHVWAEHDDIRDRGRLHIEGTHVPLAGALTQAVLESDTTRDGIDRVWRYLDPRGYADVKVDLPLGEHPDPLRLEAYLQNASIRLDAEEAEHPIEVTDVSGWLTAVGDRIVLRDVTGRVEGARVAIEGSIEGGTEGRWDLRVQTDVLRLSHEFVAALEDLGDGDPLLPEGLTLGKGARLELGLHLHRDQGTDAEIDADVHATHLDATLLLPEGTTLTLRGDRLDVEGEHVRLEGIHADAPGIRVDVEHARLGPEGLQGQVTLALDDYTPSDDLLALLPEEAKDLLSEWTPDRTFVSEALTVLATPDGGLRFEGDLAFHASADAPSGGAPRGGLEFRPLTLSGESARGERTLAGRIHFDAFSFGDAAPVDGLDGAFTVDRLVLGDHPRGRGTLRATAVKLFDIRARDLEIPLRWQDDILLVDPVDGLLAEGRLRGRIRIHTRAPEAYEGDLTIEGFRLSALQADLSPTGAQLTGRGEARVSFQSRSGETRDLTAQGTLRVRDGNLGDLPVAANIFAFLGSLLDVPEPPRFERLDADFVLQDEVVRLRRFDMAGPLFDMPGHGSIDLGGFVDLTFTPDVIKSFLLPGIMQFPVVGDVMDAILREDILYAIRLRGDVATAEPEVIPLPPLGLGSERPFEGTGVPQLPPRRVPRRFR